MKDDADRIVKAPENVKEAFGEFTNDCKTLNDFLADEFETWGGRDKFKIDWLIGLLGDCTEAMPANVSNALDLPRGATFAQGAERLHWMREHKRWP